MEIEGNSLERVATNFRTLALNEGMTGETVERLSKSPERALACLEAAIAKGAGPGLAVHMFDAGDWPSKPRQTGTNLHAHSDCETCGGDRFVLVSTRPAVPSIWAIEHKLKLTGEEYEEYAACPDCGPEMTPMRRADGSFWVPPDPVVVRQKMRQS